VAGSGPAGVFSALGALGEGTEVLMIDPGLEIPAELAARAAALARVQASSWRAGDVDFIKGRMRTTPSGISEKTLYGSDFASRPLRFFPTELENCHAYASHAKGGLSNVWGRGVEPLYAGEHAGWSFVEDLRESYRAVLEQLPLAAARDNLDEVLPLYTRESQPAPLSPQFSRIHRNLVRHTEGLNTRGIHFGQSRFLIRFASDDDRYCRLCNMCMFGCPYGAMYSTPDTLTGLEELENFEYRGGIALDSFVDTGDGVRLRVIEIGTGERGELVADRLILAAGAVNTTRIVMKSCGVPEASMKTSDMFQIPMLGLRGSGNLPDDATYSLAQLTLAIRDPAIARQSIIVHLFGYNAIFLDAVRALLPAWLYRLSKAVLPRLLARVFIGSSLVHSSQSGHLVLRLDGDTLRITGYGHPEARRIARRLYWKLLRNSLRTGLVPLPFFARKPPGGSAHCGASLPIDGRSNPSTQRDGSLASRRNVYVADASSLPDIPAGSYTLTIMANAHRIGREVRRRTCAASSGEPGVQGDGVR
jgi:hypothetical protein